MCVSYMTAHGGPLPICVPPYCHAKRDKSVAALLLPAGRSGCRSYFSNLKSSTGPAITYTGAVGSPWRSCCLSRASSSALQCGGSMCSHTTTSLTPCRHHPCGSLGPGAPLSRPVGSVQYHSFCCLPCASACVTNPPSPCTHTTFVRVHWRDKIDR